MGAAGITIIVVALFVAYEGLKHFRATKVSAATGSAGASGGTSSGSGATSSGGAPSAGGSVQPAGGSLPAATPTGYASGIQNVIDTAKRMGINPDALLALVGWESDNYNPGAYNANDPGGSRGYYQLNAKANPSLTNQCAFDPACASNYWYMNYGPHAVQLWNSLGGNSAYVADPAGFLQKWVPAVQVSDPWSPSIAQTALARVRALQAYLGGSSTQTSQPTVAGSSQPA